MSTKNTINKVKRHSFNEFIYFKCTVMCMWILYFQVYSIGLYIQSDSTLSHFSPHTELTRLLNMEIDQCIHLAV